LVLLLITVVAGVVSAGSTCGGNCPGRACPTCPCGTKLNIISDNQVLVYLQRSGLPPSTHKTFLCIIQHESGKDTNAMNWNENQTMDIGLAQINKVNQAFCNVNDVALCDGQKNLNCAFALWAEDGFGPWSGDGGRCGFTHLLNSTSV